MHYIIYLIAALILQSVPVRDSHEKIKEEKKKKKKKSIRSQKWRWTWSFIQSVQLFRRRLAVHQNISASWISIDSS